MKTSKAKANKKAETKKPSVQKDPRVGLMFKRARLESKLKLTDVVKALNISETYIKALESGDMSKLPPEQSYTLGFVRTYAHFLNLDPIHISKLFKKQHSITLVANNENHVQQPVTPKPQEETEANPVLMWGSFCGACLLLLGAYFSDAPFVKESFGVFVDKLSHPL